MVARSSCTASPASGHSPARSTWSCLFPRCLPSRSHSTRPRSSVPAWTPRLRPDSSLAGHPRLSRRTRSASDEAAPTKSRVGSRLIVRKEWPVSPGFAREESMMRRTIVLFVLGSAAVLARADALAALDASPPVDSSPAASGTSAPAGSASDNDRVGALEKLLKEMQAQYEARIAALEREVAALKGAPAAGAPAAEAAPAPPPVTEVAQAPPPAPPLAAAPSQTSNYFNPSVSAIGNFLGVAGP